jgi:hypothetical protein
LDVIETREDLIQFVDQHNIPGPVVQNTLGISKQTWCNARKGMTWTKGIPAKLHVGVAELVAQLNGADVLGKQEEISAPEGRPEPEASAPVADEHGSTGPLADWSDQEGADDDRVDVTGLIEHIRAWADCYQTEPPAEAVLAEIQHLVRNWATAMVQEAFISAFLDRWWSALRAKDKDRKVTMLNRTWKQEAKEHAEDIEREDLAKMPPIIVPDLDEVRAALREELWPAVQEMAMRPDLLSHVVQHAHQLGVVGEEDVIKLVYLAGTSRVTVRPVCPLISGASGGGKSFVSQQTLRLLPPEDVVIMTTGSALSLVYDEDQSLEHKVLCVYEATQLQADDNSVFALSLRTLLSEGRIVHKTVVTAPDGTRRTETIIKEGPVSLVITTTSHDIHAENETRMTRIQVHEDAEQTRAVMRRLGHLASGAEHESADAELGVWHDFQRWIGAGPRSVVVPFAARLTENIPPVAVRFRRDVSAVLALIKAHALIHQAQRETTESGAVVATMDDYRAVMPIGARLMEESAGKRPPERVVAVVQHVQQALATQEAARPPAKPGRRPVTSRRITPHRDGDVYVASIRSLGEELGLDRKSAEHAIRRALDDNFIVNMEPVRGRPMRLVMGTRTLADVSVVMLPDPDTL